MSPARGAAASPAPCRPERSSRSAGRGLVFALLCAKLGRDEIPAGGPAAPKTPLGMTTVGPPPHARPTAPHLPADRLSAGRTRRAPLAAARPTAYRPPGSRADARKTPGVVTESAASTLREPALAGVTGRAGSCLPPERGEPRPGGCGGPVFREERRKQKRGACPDRIDGARSLAPALRPAEAPTGAPVGASPSASAARGSPKRRQACALHSGPIWSRHVRRADMECGAPAPLLRGKTPKAQQLAAVRAPGAKDPWLPAPRTQGARLAAARPAAYRPPGSGRLRPQDPGGRDGAARRTAKPRGGPRSRAADREAARRTAKPRGRPLGRHDSAAGRAPGG